MTKKDYVKFAEVIRDRRMSEASVSSVPNEMEMACNRVVDSIQYAIELIFTEDNPRFDIDLFDKACH